MYLIPFAVLGTWLILLANRSYALLSVVRYCDYQEVVWTAQAYTAGYFAVALATAFVRPWGLLVTAWLFSLALTCRLRA
jgi:hypothetical protein